MKKTFKILMLTAVYAAAVLVQACDGNEDEFTTITQEEEVDITGTSNMAEITSDEDVEYINGLLAASASNGRIASESCAVVTRDKEKKVITIDFGDGCTGSDGRERSGKIFITYGGGFNDDIANRVITFEDYYVNNLNISGAIEIRNFNRNEEGNLTSTRKLIDYTNTYPDGNTFVMNGSTTRELIEGEGDGNRQNDVVSITGSYTGISTKGREFTRIITEPVIADFNCRAAGGFIRVAGKIEMTIKGTARERTRIIYYGDGTCDNEYIITVNGKEKTVTTS